MIYIARNWNGEWKIISVGLRLVFGWGLWSAQHIFMELWLVSVVFLRNMGIYPQRIVDPPCSSCNTDHVLKIPALHICLNMWKIYVKEKLDRAIELFENAVETACTLF